MKKLISIIIRLLGIVCFLTVSVPPVFAGTYDVPATDDTYAVDHCTYP
jgi:hypothetical protein